MVGNRLRTLWRHLRGKPADDLQHFAHVTPASSSGRIDDGLDYAQPVLLPGYLERALDAAGKLTTYLAESAAQTFRFQFDTPQRGTADMPVQMATEDPLREWNEATREMVLANCHAAFERNPIANAGVKYATGFIIGDGFNLACKNKELGDFLYEFSERNKLRTYETLAVTDLQLDGELFLRFFPGTGEAKGLLRVVPQRPWECRWIKTERGDFQTVLNYRMRYTTTEGDDPTGGTETEELDIPADQMLHVAINRRAYELRGRPELYCILPWLRAYKEWLENRARQNHWRNALLWWMKIKGALSTAIVTQLAAKFSRPPEPGSVFTSSEMVEPVAVTNPVGAGDASDDGRAIKLMSIVGQRLPEYFFADGANANLASSTSQELPALTKFSSFQQILIEQLYYPLFERAVQEAIDAGLLPDEVEEQDADGDPIYEEPETTEQVPVAMPLQAPTNGAQQPPALPKPKARKAKTIETLKAFEVSYEPMQKTDVVNLAQAIGQYLDHDVWSIKKAQIESGADPAIEEKQKKREREQAKQEMMQDVATGFAMPPGFRAEGAEDDKGEERSSNGQETDKKPVGAKA